MTEQQAQQVVKSQGWTPRTRIAHGTVKRYLYAYRRNRDQGGKTIERYVCKVEALTGMEEADILKRLS